MLLVFKSFIVFYAKHLINIDTMIYSIITTVLLLYGMIVSPHRSNKFEANAICVEIVIVAESGCATTYCALLKNWVCEEYGNGNNCDSTDCATANCDPY